MIRNGVRERLRRRHARLVEVLERDAGAGGWLRCARQNAPWRHVEAIVQSRHRYGGEAVGLYIVRWRDARG